MKKMIVVVLLVAVCCSIIPQSAFGAPDAPTGIAAIQNLPAIGAEITIGAYDGTQYAPQIAYNWKHDEYLVVWEGDDLDGVARIYGQRVSASGELLGAQPDAIAGGNKAKFSPDVDYDPVNDRYLVVWVHDVVGDGSNLDIAGRFIPWDGSTPTLPEFKISDWATNQWDPKVAYGRADEKFMVVWRTVLASSSEISAILVPADGSAFNPSGGFTVAANINTTMDDPDLAYNRARNEFLVAYTRWAATDFDIYAKRVTGSGTVMPTDYLFAITYDTELFASVAACAEQDQWLVTWQREVGGDYDLFTILFNGNETSLGTYTISAYAGDQAHVAASCNHGGSDYMLTWHEDIGGAIGISARPVHPDGTMGTGFQVKAPATPAGNAYPAIAGGKTNFLVAWEEQRGAVLSRDVHGKLLVPYATYLPLSLKSP